MIHDILDDCVRALFVFISHCVDEVCREDIIDGEIAPATVEYTRDWMNEYYWSNFKGIGYKQNKRIQKQQHHWNIFDWSKIRSTYLPITVCRFACERACVWMIWIQSKWQNVLWNLIRIKCYGAECEKRAHKCNLHNFSVTHLFLEK